MDKIEYIGKRSDYSDIIDIQIDSFNAGLKVYSVSTDSLNKLIEDCQKEISADSSNNISKGIFKLIEEVNDLKIRIEALESKSEPKTESVKIGDLCWFYGEEGYGKVSILIDIGLDMPYPYTDKDGRNWSNCIPLKEHIKNLQSMIKD